MWVAIYIAAERRTAEEIVSLLDKEGILVDVRPLAKSNEDGSCEIRVLRSEALEAKEILSENGL